MDSKKFKIFTISIIGILSLAGIFFLTGIILNASKGAKESQDSFAKITKEITSIADDYGILTENFLKIYMLGKASPSHMSKKAVVLEKYTHLNTMGKHTYCLTMFSMNILKAKRRHILLAQH